MGALAEGLKLYGDPDEWTEEEAPERLATLVKGAHVFLRGGGSFTLPEFFALSSTERAVLAVAGDRIKSRWTAQLAHACRSEQGEAEVRAVDDDGASLVRLALEDFMRHG